jgi:hypothetical protein
VTQEDIEDPDFLELIAKQVGEELANVVRVRRGNDVQEMLADFRVHGGMIEAGPSKVASAPAVAFYVPPVGQPQIVGSWERLFLSAYEPFASIHPGFTVTGKKLKTRTIKSENDCSVRRLVGTNIVHYWYSDRNFYDKFDAVTTKIYLTPDDVMISEYKEFLPQLIAEYVVKKPFDEEIMPIGTSTAIYVQPVFELTKIIELKVLAERLSVGGFEIGSQVVLFEDFADPKTFALIVVDESIVALVAVVYRLLKSLGTNILGNDLQGDEPICDYCRALEYLDQQVEATSGVRSTVYMKEEKGQIVRSPSRVFRVRSIAERSPSKGNGSG